MFSFFRSAQSTKNAFSFIGTDMHSHLIPFVDDGSDSNETSVQLIEGLMELGYHSLYTTPHIYQAFYPNTPSLLRPAYGQLLPDLPSDITFKLGAEYFFDEHFEQICEKGELLSMGTDKYVLIELSFVAYAQRIEQSIFELVAQGYRPILAHPERYLYLKDSIGTLQKIKDLGCALQLNALSLHGYYGKASQEMAKHLMAKNMVDFLGTDMHHSRHLEQLTAMASQKKLMQQLAAYPWKNNEIVG